MGASSCPRQGIGNRRNARLPSPFRRWQGGPWRTSPRHAQRRARRRAADASQPLPSAGRYRVPLPCGPLPAAGLPADGDACRGTVRAAGARWASPPSRAAGQTPAAAPARGEVGAGRPAWSGRDRRPGHRSVPTEPQRPASRAIDHARPHAMRRSGRQPGRLPRRRRRREGSGQAPARGAARPVSLPPAHSAPCAGTAPGATVPGPARRG